MNTRNLQILKQLSILYVEDDAEIRDQFIKLLKNFCSQIYVATNGEEGLAQFKKNNPDIVITDLKMPKMHGMEMAKEIKKINAQTPIIATTAHNESSLLLEAIETGLDAYVLKPIDMNNLLHSLEKNAKIILHAKEKEKAEKEIRYILDLNPAFILLVQKNKIEYINKTFLDFLGLNSINEYLNSAFQIEKCIVQINSLPCIQNKDEWLHEIINHPHEKHILCLCSRKSKNPENAFAYLAQCNTIPNTEKIIISFQDITDVEREKTMLEKKANTDTLTGLANRGFYDAKFKKELERAKRYNFDLSLIIFDIDHFKIINDTHGHAMGDKILKELAHLIKKNIRIHEIFARIGGEEFAILAPETSLNQAFVLAEKLLNAITTHSFENNIKVTCSFGVGIKKENDTTETLFDRTDKALYRAKNNGRNRIEIED